MEMPRALPHSQVKDLLQAIIRKREERNVHQNKESDDYIQKDKELDELLELLAQQFMSAPTRGTERFPETFPPAEEDDVLPPISSQFDPAEEFRRVVPTSKNLTRPDLDTTPREKEETPEQKREREELERIYEGGKKISAYSMKPKTSLYNTLKRAPSQLYQSISSVSRRVNPFTSKKSKKTKKSKTRKYRRN